MSFRKNVEIQLTMLLYETTDTIKENDSMVLALYWKREFMRQTTNFFVIIEMFDIEPGKLIGKRMQQIWLSHLLRRTQQYQHAQIAKIISHLLKNNKIYISFLKNDEINNKA